MARNLKLNFTFERRRKRDKIGHLYGASYGGSIKMLLRVSKIEQSRIPNSRPPSRTGLLRETFRGSVTLFFANEKIMRGLC